MTAPLNADPTPIAADDSYDAFADFDGVPGIVKGLDVTESRFWSLLSAFIGVGSAFIGASKDFHLP